MDAIYGMTMEVLAETMSKHGELKAQFGEQQGMVEFDRYLAGRGFNQHTWSLAHNGWHDRFRADPTGRAEAQFHMLLAQLSQKAHFGDVRDMSGDTEEGITLDTYAQITVEVSRQGANADDIVRKHGLQDVAHWQRANAAWTKKMGEDHTHKLTMQFGTLYQKYAGPSFQNEMMDQTAGILAARNAPQDVVDEPEVELTPELCLQKMQSPSRNERWKYAGLYANMADLGNVPDKAQAIATVMPILIEMIEQHDEHTTSDAENGARKLWDLGVRNDDFKGGVARCLNRAQEKLVSLQAAFAPIQNQAVPERVTLQSRIQDYQSLVSTMQDYMNEDWGNGQDQFAGGGGGGGAHNSFAPQYGGHPSQAPAGSWPGQHGNSGAMSLPAIPKMPGGFPKWILAPVILLFVGGIFFVTKGRAMLHKDPAAAASASHAAAHASAPKSTSEKTTAAAAHPPATPAAETAAAPAADVPAASATPAAAAKKAAKPAKKKK